MDSSRRGLLRAQELLLICAVSLTACTPRSLPEIEDNIAPRVEIKYPSDGERITNPSPTIRVEYSDKKSGIKAVTYQAYVNGIDYSAEFDQYSLGARGKIPSDNRLPIGKNTLEVQVKDRQGNIGKDRVVFVNASGGFLQVKGAEASKRFVEIVLDASGSMSEQAAQTLEEVSRMQAAKQAVKQLVSVLPGDFSLGLRVFRGCDDIESLVPIKPVDRASFIQKLGAIEPEGGTPIVDSLGQSLDAIQTFGGGQRIIVLVTDGGESCHGDISSISSKARDLQVRLHIIGFGLTKPGIIRMLAKMAKDSGGAYVDARDPDQLEQALKDTILRVPYSVLDEDGNRVATGFVDGAKIGVPLGTYEVRVNTKPVVRARDVAIGQITNTTMTLEREGNTIHHEVKGPK